jgi:hypothetical protein
MSKEYLDKFGSDMISVEITPEIKKWAKEQGELLRKQHGSIFDLLTIDKRIIDLDIKDNA